MRLRLLFAIVLFSILGISSHSLADGPCPAYVNLDDDMQVQMEGCDKTLPKLPAAQPAAQRTPAAPQQVEPRSNPKPDITGNVADQPPVEQRPHAAPTTDMPGQPGSAPSGSPNASPVASTSYGNAIVDLQKGDRAAALRDVKAGLAADPNDEHLKILDRLLNKRVDNPIDQASLDRQIKALTDERKDDLAGAPGEGGPGNPAAGATGTGTLTVMHAPRMSGVIGRPVTEFKPPPHEGALSPAYVRIRMKDYSGAEDYLNQKIHENPADWQAYRLRALARFKQGKYVGAIEDAEGALNINRRDIWVLNTLALSLTKLNRIAEALDVMKESLSLNPKNGESYFTRSEVWKQAGKPEERLADLEEAAKFDEQFKSIYEDALNESRHKNGGRRLPFGAWPWGLALGALAVLAAFGLGWKGRQFPVAETEKLMPQPLPVPSALGPGVRFGDFEIVRPIGQGGMGVVYEASDLLLGRAVAIKKLRDEIASDPKERQRFLKEARTVASLDHPHIVRIHSVLDRPEGLFLVFEYIAGDTIDRLLDRDRRLSFGDTLHHLKTVAKALDYAHRRGVIHRDLKPSNIMVTREGVAKVMDFGIAWRAQETLTRLTRKDGTAVGTPLYMAPEQSWGECVRESDVYALAMCCYEMLAGRPPFDGPNPQQLKMEKMFTPISRVLRRAPEALDRIFERALDPIHAKRFHSASELVEALEAVLPAESKT